MLREIAHILLSINLSTHAIPQVRQLALANTIQRQAESADIDPYIIVAIITHESQWAERAISQDGLDYGLMQVRHIHYGGDPEYLLNGEANIRVGTYVIKKSIEFCRKYLDREPTTVEWMTTYQGNPHSCKPTKLAQKVVDYAECLEQNVEFGHNYNCKHIYWPNIQSTEDQEDYDERS